MNARTIVLIFAVGLIGIGLVMTISDWLAGDEPVPQTVVARAAQQIEPNTVITMDMLATEEMRARDAADLNAWPVEQVAGMMATGLIAPGDLLTAAEVQPIEDFRGDTDLDNELISFTASMDRMVAGTLKPGMFINVYGTHSGAEDETYTVLVEPNVRVVSVQAGGGQPGGPGTPIANPDTGEVDYEGDFKASTMITVSLPPDRSYNLINAIGAQGLKPWVTVAGSSQVAVSTPPAPPSGQTVPEIDVDATMTALWRELAPPTPQADLGTTGGGGTSR
jgi:hypothetical protein